MKRTVMKKMIAVLSVILIVLVGAAGTLTYLQVKTNDVVNTFAPSNIGLTLVESPNTYKMVPGVDIAKDPKVTVTSDIDCYVFVKVVESSNVDTFLSYTVDTNVWTPLVDANGVKVDGVYYCAVTAAEATDGKEFFVLTGKGTAELKNGFVTVSAEVTKDQMNALYKADGSVNTAAQPKLTFTAYAIQQAGFEGNPAGAWAQAQG